MESNMENALILEELRELKQDIKEIKTCLFGNGKTGICTRLTLLETFQNSAKRLLWIVIGSILTIATAAVAMAWNVKLPG